MALDGQFQQNVAFSIILLPLSLSLPLVSIMQCFHHHGQWIFYLPHCLLVIIHPTQRVCVCVCGCVYANPHLWPWALPMGWKTKGSGGFHIIARQNKLWDSVTGISLSFSVLSHGGVGSPCSVVDHDDTSSVSGSIWMRAKIVGREEYTPQTRAALCYSVMSELCHPIRSGEGELRQ